MVTSCDLQRHLRQVGWWNKLQWAGPEALIDIYHLSPLSDILYFPTYGQLSAGLSCFPAGVTQNFKWTDPLFVLYFLRYCRCIFH